MGRLAGYVHVTDAEGVSHAFGPGVDVPDWAAALIVNPKAWEGGVLPASSEAPAEAPAVPPAAVPAPPPRHGSGSSKQAWAGYAETVGVQVPDDAGRDDIIIALERAGHPVG